MLQAWAQFRLQLLQLMGPRAHDSDSNSHQKNSLLPDDGGGSDVGETLAQLLPLRSMD